MSQYRRLLLEKKMEEYPILGKQVKECVEAMPGY
jgi:hypothetical protein